MPEPERQASDSERLPLDARGERGVAVLGFVAAGVALASGAWLWLYPGLVPRAFGLAALAFSPLALRRALRSRRAARSSDAYYLELGATECRVRAGEREERVAWASVQAVVFDEDRLHVCLERADGPAFEIEPRYAGLGAAELARRVHAAWQAAEVRRVRSAER